MLGQTYNRTLDKPLSAGGRGGGGGCCGGGGGSRGGGIRSKLGERYSFVFDDRITYSANSITNISLVINDLLATSRQSAS